MSRLTAMALASLAVLCFSKLKLKVGVSAIIWNVHTKYKLLTGLLDYLVGGKNKFTDSLVLILEQKVSTYPLTTWNSSCLMQLCWILLTPLCLPEVSLPSPLYDPKPGVEAEAFLNFSSNVDCWKLL